MGYSIQYKSDGGKLREKRKKWGKVILSVLAMSCGVIVWYQLYRRGVMLKLERFARAVGCGTPLQEAIEAFWLEFLENG